jgi:hypothetical protein
MDPITIGLAFTAAQAAVSHIKQAIALGKDIHGLVGQFSKFFDSADTIHRAKVRSNYAGKSNAELGKLALQAAMHSDALRQAERELKDMIIWQLGKPQVWEDMIRERTRLFKERAAEEHAADVAAAERKKKTAKQAMFAVSFIGGAAVVFGFIFGGVQIYGRMEDAKIYEQKVARRQQLIYQQHKARIKEEKKQLAEDAASGG